MSHWRKLFNNVYLGSWDLEGRVAVTLEIEKVQVEEIKNASGKSDQCPVVYFAGTKTHKGMVLNRTNARAIAAQHGNDCEKWPGKKIRLVVRQVTAFGTTTDALRVE